MQSVKLYTFDDTDVMLSSRESYFDEEFVFSNGLMFSFALTAYDSNPEAIEDPSIGVVKPYYKSWGLDNEVSGVKWEELPLRNCTLAEFHLRNETDPNSLFFKPHPNSERDLDFYFNKMKCIDKKVLQVQGDYNSPKAQSFAILFEKCDNSTYTGPGTCKSEVEII